MKGINKYLFTLLLLLLTAAGAFSQQRTVNYNLSEWLSSNRLSTTNRNASQSANRGIKLSAAAGDGIVWLNGVKFENGVIELDVKGKSVEQQSFLGIAFHGLEDTKTYDAIYFRPFNFKAADAVKRSHSVQYVSHPDYPWALLREKFNGKYESEIASPPDPDNWFHIRIEVNYPTLRVFVNGGATPSLVVNKLNERRNGIMGVWVGNNSDGEFANLKVTFLN